MDNRLALPLHCVSLIILCGAAPSSQPAQRPLTRPSEDQSRRLVVVQSLAQEYAAKIAAARADMRRGRDFPARIRAELIFLRAGSESARWTTRFDNTDADEAYETAAKRVTDAERAKEHALYEGYDKYLATVHRYDNAMRDMESRHVQQTPTARLPPPPRSGMRRRLAQAMKTDLELKGRRILKIHRPLCCSKPSPLRNSNCWPRWA